MGDQGVSEATQFRVDAQRADWSTATDSFLIELVQRGERSAFGELVRRYEKRLLRAIYRLVGHVDTAEDLTQDAFLKAYDRLSQFDASRRFGPWLFQIGTNGAIDWMRRNRRRHLVHLSDLTRGEGNFDIAAADQRGQNELTQEVQRVLTEIPLEYRTVLTLRDMEGYPCSEVAAIIGRREPTVRWRLARAREMFREIWERRAAKGK
jgi:RNA polymerase sigma-70 factor (ECF subfamily)